MTGRSRVMWKAIVVAALLSLVASAAAEAQSSKKGSHAAPSGETKPRVDEKACRPRSTEFPRRRSPMIPGRRSTSPNRQRSPPANQTRAFSSEAVRVKKTRQNNNLEPGFDSIKTG